MVKHDRTEDDWNVGDRFANLSTPWFTLIGEHIQADGQTLDYWRIEKADSVIVLPIQSVANEPTTDHLLLPPPPCIVPASKPKRWTFPGGAAPLDKTPATPLTTFSSKS